jgi:signal transduction histidine kinase
MDTYFAPAEKTNKIELTKEIDIVNNNPVVSGLLQSINGLLAILDENRQVVSLNYSFIEMLGIDNPMEAMGLRLGEVLQCIYSKDAPGGCGTTRCCSTCGAAIAMVASLGQDTPIEKTCAITINKNNKQEDIVLLVKSHPIRIEGNRFLLLFLKDITLQEKRAALERTFFHDINNMMSMLLGTSELLIEENPSELAMDIFQAAQRLHKEISIQHYLSQNDSSSYQPAMSKLTIEKIFIDLKSFFTNHPVVKNKNLHFHENCSHLSIHTDSSLVSRILCNMIINAFEATDINGTVKIWDEHKDNQVSFYVWNTKEIPEEISRRLFQRNFSTKDGAGRGIGTFSMKLFGEDVLGGKVSFTSTKKKGTTFKFSLPLSKQNSSS